MSVYAENINSREYIRSLLLGDILIFIQNFIQKVHIYVDKSALLCYNC